MKESESEKASVQKETKWTDASIRWPEDGPKTYDSEEEEECGYMDPFKEPDPFQIFSFKFEYIEISVNPRSALSGEKISVTAIAENFSGNGYFSLFKIRRSNTLFIPRYNHIK